MYLKFYKHFFIFLLSLNFNCFSNISTERNLMIFWDCTAGEILYIKLRGYQNLIGPVTTESLIALYQEPGAILISTFTLKNILLLGEFFKDFVEKSTEELKKKYGRYTRFEDDDSITTFAETCKYVNENYHKLLDLLKDSSTKEEFYKKIQDDPFFDWENTPQIAELEQATTYLMCAYLPFERYTIKKFDSYGYLFVPNSYLNKLDIDPNLLKSNDGDLDEQEIKLGLKINHLTDTKIDPEEIVHKKITLKDIITSKDCRQSLLKVLDLVFVKNTDVTDSELLKPWAIYLNNHGMFNQKFHEEVQKLKNAKAELNSKLEQIAKWKKEYEESQKKYPNYSKSLAGIELEGKIRFGDVDRMGINIRISSLHSNKEAFKPKVAGLTLKQFKQLLKFFNNRISTGFLFYTSCFAGGQLAIDVYKDETTNKISNFNYTIATDSSFDVPTRKEIISTPLSSYVNHEENIFHKKKLEKIVDFNEKRVILHSNFDYINFFNQLAEFPSRSGSYLELFTNLNPLLKNFKIRLINKEWIEALPSIRFPGTTWFNTIELPKSVIQLTKVKTLTRGSTPLIIDQTTKEN